MNEHVAARFFGCRVDILKIGDRCSRNLRRAVDNLVQQDELCSQEEDHEKEPTVDRTASHFFEFLLLTL